MRYYYIFETKRCRYALRFMHTVCGDHARIRRSNISETVRVCKTVRSILVSNPPNIFKSKYAATQESRHSLSFMALRQVLVDDTDPSIQYGPEGWFVADPSKLNVGNFGPIYNATSHATTSSNSTLSYSFNGARLDICPSSSLSEVAFAQERRFLSKAP